MMKWLALAFLIPYFCTAAEEKHEIVMSLSDRFVVSGTEKWSVSVEKILPLRFANVRITPKTGAAFDLMLYFKCDTSDLAHFNTPKKIERSVRSSSEAYLPAIVE